MLLAPWIEGSAQMLLLLWPLLLLLLLAALLLAVQWVLWEQAEERQELWAAGTLAESFPPP